ncbi:MAG: ARPP-1 family domain-containing protein [Candidatus Thorarchaeota archaeon]|jgi:hypothetical protein
MSISESIKHIRDFAGDILGNSEFSLENPVSHEGISFVPIVLNEEEQDQEYVNAALALESGTLIISEVGDAVNSLLAQNTGNIPVLIEEAEVLASRGSQDRIVVASVILQPGEETRIPVKCVHAPHALSKSSRYMTVGSGSVPLKSGMRRMKYQSIMTDVDHYEPETAVDQREVWSEVAKHGKSFGLGDPTKYVEAMAEIKKKASHSAKEIGKRLPDNTCGFVVVDATGTVASLEFYRNVNSFKHRTGVIEAIVFEYSNQEKSSVGKKKARIEALQLLSRLQKAKKTEAVSKEGSTLIGTALDGSSKLFYCSLGR